MMLPAIDDCHNDHATAINSIRDLDIKLDYLAVSAAGTTFMRCRLDFVVPRVFEDGF